MMPVKRRGPGAPYIGPGRGVILTQVMWDRLERHAAQEGTSVNAVLRDIVKDALYPLESDQGDQGDARE